MSSICIIQLICALQYHWIFNDPEPEVEADIDEEEEEDDNSELSDDEIGVKHDQDETEIIPYFNNSDREHASTSSDTFDDPKSPS